MSRIEALHNLAVYLKKNRIRANGKFAWAGWVFVVELGQVCDEQPTSEIVFNS